MRFSRALESSPYSFPSPDGELLATLLPASILVRAVESLEVIRSIRLPRDFTGSVTNFGWSSSSRRVLVAASDHLHVFSVRDGDFHGTARIPSPAAKASFIDFGATDCEVRIWCPFGIKLTLINFANPKVIEIANPKFHNAASATRGCSSRAGTDHLALLTRTAGKDMISIHSPGTREVERSWHSDTIDAQGLAWTADGRWLVVWESVAQSSRVLFYTSDGHIFKDWRAPLTPASGDMGLEYSGGVRTVALSPDGRYAAIANGSTCICVLNTPSMAEAVRLRHPQVIQPRDTLQVWQEQNTLPNTGSFSLPGFVRASQAVTPQWTALNSLQEPISGCNLAKFDSSSSLLATRLEDAPGTIWIWDVLSSDLRAVLMYHANVTKLEWHPVQPELLLLRCEGDDYGNLVFVWDPLGRGPRSIDITTRFPGPVNGRTHATWLKTTTESAALFFTDSATCMVISLADSDGEALPWRDGSMPANSTGHKGNAGMQPSSRHSSPSDDAEDSIGFDMDDDLASEPDDTFEFRKFIGR
ncbi:hypothetical protein GGS23DRAFT_604121 [Durotheca rogersii]|uniref:uncharacterized protein n=1 Tax=Durotheca rogersii TaxID=419775 RepID=UPI00221FB6DD|nr:uncharacterized protein GGS23DRAFT_604121 [Durotheca rogersii]KAI5864468.1 hypothetical protein GGS23DRAFT_604121 [Durotheca rogersii]